MDISELETSFEIEVNTDMQNLKFKYRLYPTEEQESQLRQVIGSNRYIWNHFLEQEQNQYNQNKTFNFYNSNSKDLTALKKTIPWLNEIPSVSLQQTLRYLDQSLKQSFPKNGNGRKGFPKFKKRKNFQGSFTLTMINSKVNLEPDYFKCPKIGEIKAVIHRDLPSDFASCQIKQEAGKWFVVFTVKKEKKEKVTPSTAVGIDLNSKEHVCFDGCNSCDFKNPKYLRENQAKIKWLQQQLSRKKKGSNNRRKAQLKLARAHNDVRNKRLDWMHKMTRQLIDDYDIICIEDLDVKGIQKKYGNIIQDNGFAGIRHMLEYKAELYGKHLVVINRFFPSSQKCSNCECITKHKLENRIFNCQHCDLYIPRDLNSAINILRAGTAQFASGCIQLVEIDIMLSKLIGADERGSHVL